MDRTFDRIVRFDERSRAYPVMAAISKTTPRSYSWKCDVWLDQGREGACVGFGVTHEAAARPVAIKKVSNVIAQSVYKRAQAIDPWEGDDYDGTDVLSGIKIAKENGWILEYRWAFSELELAMAIGHVGPAIIGVPWYEGMMNPDINNRIHVTGQNIGGHCTLVNGYNHKRREYKIHNSWGRDWGVDGECWISADDMAKLLRERGEACIPTLRGNPK